MSSKRHLLVVTRSLPFHAAGGMEHVAWDVAHALADSGLALTVLTTRVPGRPYRFTENGVAVVALQEAAPGRYSGGFWRASRSWYRENALDVGAVLSVSAGAYGLLSERTRRPEVRFVMQAHGTSIGELRARWRGPGLGRRLASARNLAWLGRDLRSYGRFDRIVAVGPRVEAQLRSRPLRWFVGKNRVIRVDNGIDTTRFRPDMSLRSETREALGWSASDLGIVTVCRLHAQKGVLEALRGFARFASGHHGTERLLVVGSGPERAVLESEAASMLPPGSFSFCGEVRREDVPRLLNAADVFLFLGLRTEVGMPLNVLEAAATGLPLVLSDVLRPDLQPPVEAECVSPRDPAGVAAALSRAAASPAVLHPAARISRLPAGLTLDTAAARYAAILFPQARA